MDSQTFKQLQPIAYRTLTNSINGGHFAHAYLFCGTAGVQLAGYAEFLIQSLLCENTDGGLACGVCDNCRRITQGLYADIVRLSGTDKTVTKKEVLQLISQLTKTGLEAKGLKFYLIEEVDNATTEALNSLLKFLEEPGNQQTFAILTTNQLPKVLPTIVSRCLKIAFRPYPKSQQDPALAAGAYNSEYYLCGSLYNDPALITQMLDDELFQRSLAVFRKSLELLVSDFDNSLVVLLSEGLTDRKTDKAVLNNWLALNIQFFKDLNYVQQLPEGWYQQLLKKNQCLKNDSTKILSILLSAFDQLDLSLNSNLLAEKIYWQLKGATS